MSRTCKVYLASPFFNAEQVRRVEDIERTFAKAPDGFFNLYSPRHDGVLMHMTPKERTENSGRIFQNNIDQLTDASLVVAVIDGKDAGTIFEMGYAFADGTRILAYTEEKKTVNIMLRHSCIGVVRSPLELHQFLAAWHNTDSIDFVAQNYQKWDEGDVT